MFVFVIMPFDEEFSGIYRNLIIPSFEEEGYTVRRADNVIDQQNILKDIVSNIVNADLIVADLTSLNPNVLYELGIAHGLDKPTVLLTQAIDELPFDLRSYRVVPYSTHYEDAQELKDTLGSIAVELAHDGINFGNPVSDYAPEALSERDYPLMMSRPDADEPGILDYIVDGQEALNDIVDYMNRITNITEDATEKINKYNAQIEVAKRNDRNVMSQLHRIATGMAMEMMQYADQIKGELPGLRDAWDIAETSLTGFVRTAQINDEEDRQALVNLQATAADSLNALEGARDSAVHAIDQVSELEGISRELNRAVNRVKAALRDLTEEYEMGIAFLIRIQNVVDERLSR